MYAVFQKEIGENEPSTILDVGVSSDEEYVFSNYFEALYPYKKNIKALGLFDCSFLENKYRGLSFILGDGKKIPLEDNSVDVVFSSATIEHVGSFAEQKIFLAEAIRVANKSVFITTPNRWFFIDPHTAIPLLHFLPKKIHRAILSMIGKKALSLESNLNLMCISDFKKILKDIPNITFYFKYNYFLGFKSNIIAIIKK